MSMEKVIFGFVVLLAATLNFGFVVGDIADPALHNVAELYLAVAVNIIAAVLKFGDRTQIDTIQLATSLVAVLQLVAAASVYVYATQVAAEGLSRGLTSTMVSLAAGALLANVSSVVMLVAETVSYRRR